MLLIYFCLPIVLLIVIANVKRIVLKATSYQSQDHSDYAVITFIVRILLFIVFIFTVKSCGQAFLDKASEEPPDQAFDSKIWKKDAHFGEIRHTMLKSLKEHHSFLLEKNRTQVIEILGTPDTLSGGRLNTDSTLYWRSQQPNTYMGGGEFVIVIFRKCKSQKILFDR